MTAKRMICPHCERSIDLEQADMAEMFRERCEVAARLGHDAWLLANEYVESFRPESGSRITPKKRTRLLREILKLWESQEFELGGKRYRTTRPEIIRALTAVCNAQKSGFKNHNYLKRILIPSAARVSAEGMTAGEEAGREERRRSAREAEDVLTAEEFKRRRGMESLADILKGGVPREG